MKSEWRVTSNVFDGCVKKYAVYRLLDVSEVDHSGNREYIGDYTEDREIARSAARQLNILESPGPKN